MPSIQLVCLKQVNQIMYFLLYDCKLTVSKQQGCTFPKVQILMKISWVCKIWLGILLKHFLKRNVLCFEPPKKPCKYNSNSFSLQHFGPVPFCRKRDIYKDLKNLNNNCCFKVKFNKLWFNFLQRLHQDLFKFQVKTQLASYLIWSK